MCTYHKQYNNTNKYEMHLENSSSVLHYKYICIIILQVILNH